MSLALGRCDLVFDWSDEWGDDVATAAQMALVDVAGQIAEVVGTSPDTPEDTGALKDSVRVAPPGYQEDDYPLVTRLGRADPLNNPPLNLRRDAGAALAAFRERSGNPGRFSGPGDYRELVEELPDRWHTWVGSFIYYAFWVHEGFYNTRARRDIAGRPYLAEPAMRLLADRYMTAFWAAWSQVRYGGA